MVVSSHLSPSCRCGAWVSSSAIGIQVTFDREWRPDGGSFDWEFSFDPLHYGATGDRKREFVSRVRKCIEQVGFVFNNEVRVEWTLHVDEQERMETADGADVDNFAKLLNDSIKGPSGVLIDDAQIQRLEIAWQAARGAPYFELRIGSHPDSVTSKPFKLYEMPDRRWYPMSDEVMLDPGTVYVVCEVIAMSVQRHKDVRHAMRQMGVDGGDAFRSARPLQLISLGFHNTRVADDDHVLVAMSEWRASSELVTSEQRAALAAMREKDADIDSLARALLPSRRRGRS